VQDDAAHQAEVRRDRIQPDRLVDRCQRAIELAAIAQELRVQLMSGGVVGVERQGAAVVVFRAGPVR
jgi:hypothetical protein